MSTNQLGIRNSNIIVPVTPGSSMPAGTIISYSGSIAGFTSTAMADSTTLIHKDGWAVCNGASVPKATYSQLFARLDTTWNATANPLTGSNQSAPADATNNFRIPNLQGVFLRSVADYSGSDAYDTANDVVLGVYKVDKFQDHKHVSIAASGLNNLANAGAAGLFAFDSGNSTISGQATQTSTGYGAPRIGTETAPKQIGVYYLIKLYDNLAAVDVFIPPASAGVAGLVDTGAQSFAGNKTLTGATTLGPTTGGVTHVHYGATEFPDTSANTSKPSIYSAYSANIGFNGALDCVVGGNSMCGIATIIWENAAAALSRNSAMYFVSGRVGDAPTATKISNTIGSGADISTYCTVSVLNNNSIRVTHSTNDIATYKVSIMFMGITNGG